MSWPRICVLRSLLTNHCRSSVHITMSQHGTRSKHVAVRDHDFSSRPCSRKEFMHATSPVARCVPNTPQFWPLFDIRRLHSCHALHSLLSTTTPFTSSGDHSSDTFCTKPGFRRPVLLMRLPRKRTTGYQCLGITCTKLLSYILCWWGVG